MKKTKPKNEWSQLLKELSSIWFAPEVLNEVSKYIKRFFKERAEHYYDVDEFGMDPNLVENIRPLFQFLYHDYWNVDVKGVKNIPDKGRALIVSNHSGGIPFDGTMINMAVYNEHPKSRNVRFLLEDFVYHFPHLGTFITRMGGVRACPENTVRLLEKENLVAIFPEGIKGIGKLHKDKYKLQRFGRGGYVKIAIETKTKIIPTAVIGAEETYPILWKTTILSKPLGIPYFPVTPTFPILGPLGMIPLPAKWEIRFGRPIDCSIYKKSDAEDDLLIFRINQKVKSEIQKLLK